MLAIASIDFVLWKPIAQHRFRIAPSPFLSMRLSIISLTLCSFFLFFWNWIAVHANYTIRTTARPYQSKMTDLQTFKEGVLKKGGLFNTMELM